MATKQIISMPKGKDEIRFDVYKPKSGPAIGSIRVFYKAGEEMKPGKQGMTLKKSEFKEFVANLKELYNQLPDDEE